jgi:hypothetical protein
MKDRYGRKIAARGITMNTKTKFFISHSGLTFNIYYK